MDGFFVFGFIAAAVGGLESPLGAVVAGLMIGLAQQFLLDYAPSGVSSFAPVIILVVALMIRPQGLFSSVKARRV
jgi:branched-chain amino acid transport system permease protein